MGESIFSKFFNLFKKTKNNDSSGMESTSDRYGINTAKDNSLYDQESVGERYGTDEGATYVNPIFDAIAEQNLQKQEVPEQELPKQELPEQETAENEVTNEAVTGTQAEANIAPAGAGNAGPLPNLLENIGGLPTKESIKKMADGLSLRTIFLYKHFSKALDALDKYQNIMKEEHTISVNESAMRRHALYLERTSGIDVHPEAVGEAYRAMGEFIYQADAAIKNMDGFFVKRSGNAKKLAPIFANLLVQAYGLLPKLAHLESAVAPYLIETDKETYTFSEIINHKVVAGRSDGLAMRGLQQNNGAIMISPKDALEAIKSSRDAFEDEDAIAEIKNKEEEIESQEITIKSTEEEFYRAKEKYESLKGSNDIKIIKQANSEMNGALAEFKSAKTRYNSLVKQKNNFASNMRGNAYNSIMNFRKAEMEKVRMKVQIPVMPVGVLKKQRQDIVVDEAQAKTLEHNAEKIADAYIAELRLLMTALDDTAESYEFSGNTERADVHDKQAEHFRMSRLLYRVIQNRNLLKNVIIHGIPENGKTKRQEYQDIINLNSLGNKTLSEAVGQINQQAQNPEKFARLVDEKGKELREEEDYHVGGGATSIAILDFHNQRVLRAPKNLSKEEQNTALNGIKDEAAGKIAQFLGFNVCAQAEAAGFMGKGEAGEKETSVFGGSIMEMAKGAEANYFNLLMRSEDEEKMIEQRRGEKFYNVDIMKNGRLIGDIMKMDVLDYIIQHEDRHAANFLINLDAGENESMVTAIDNDMILGIDHCDAVRTGGDKSSEALLGINNRAVQTYGVRLEASFPMMPRDIKDSLQNLDLGAFNQMLMPYADRVMRMAAVHRASELKEWAKKVPTCDLSTSEGIEKFIRVAVRNGVTDWVERMAIDECEVGGVRQENDQQLGVTGLSSTLLQMIGMSYSRSFNETSGVSDIRYEKVKDILGIMKALGLSKKEVEEILRNKLGYKVNREIENTQKITETQFERTLFAKYLAEYDEL